VRVLVMMPSCRVMAPPNAPRNQVSELRAAGDVSGLPLVRAYARTLVCSNASSRRSTCRVPLRTLSLLALQHPVVGFIEAAASSRAA